MQIVKSEYYTTTEGNSENVMITGFCGDLGAKVSLDLTEYYGHQNTTEPVRATVHFTLEEAAEIVTAIKSEIARAKKEAAKKKREEARIARLHVKAEEKAERLEALEAAGKVA